MNNWTLDVFYNWAGRNRSKDTVKGGSIFSLQPKIPFQADTWAERAAGLYAPHMLPLTSFVEGLRQRKGPGYEIPYLDPDDDDINANALFLMEAPPPPGECR